MSLSRTIARPLMASIFLVGPIQTLRNSQGVATKAEPVTDPLVKLAQRAGIPLPQDPEKLVKINAGVQIVAGLCLATGRWPRLSAAVLATTLVPTTVAGHDFWNETDPDVRRQQQLQVAKNLSLLGGLIIAAGDTDGKPGVAWLAKHAASDLHRDLGHAAHTAKLEGKVAVLEADRGTAAVGATLGTALLAAGQRAKTALEETAVHVAETAQEKGPIVAAAAREHASSLAASAAEVAQEKGPIVAAAAREHASSLAASAADAAHEARAEAEPVIKDLNRRARKQARHARKQAEPVIKDLRKQAKKQAKQARKQAKHVRKQAEPVIKDLRKDAKKQAKKAKKMAQKKGPELVAAAREQASTARDQAMAAGEAAKAKIA